MGSVLLLRTVMCLSPLYVRYKERMAVACSILSHTAEKCTYVVSFSHIRKKQRANITSYVFFARSNTKNRYRTRTNLHTCSF